MAATASPPRPPSTDGAECTGRVRSLRAAASGSRFLAVLCLLVLLFAFFSITQEEFFTSANLTNLLSNVSMLCVVSIGMTFVMLSGGFDLSLGALLALAGILFGELVSGAHVPVVAALLMTLLAGLALGGLINGVLIGRMGLSFLVVTLGTFSLYGGVLNLWSNAETIPLTSSLLDRLAFDKIVGLPVAVWIMVAVFLAALYVLRGTYFGRDVYAVGGNPQAARLSGIDVARTIVVVYAIAGLLSALAGIMQVARIGAASPLVGQTIVFDAAAAVLLGGTRFSGGVGGVTGTVVGVLFLGVLQNGLAVAGVESFWQQVVSGLILIAAVALDRFQREGWAGLGFGRAR